jgi:hypothetical protein
MWPLATANRRIDRTSAMVRFTVRGATLRVTARSSPSASLNTRATVFPWSFARNSRMRVAVTAVSGMSPKNGATWTR